MLNLLNEPINIATDGQVATEKTSIGSELAKLLKYKFIDTGLFYCYFAATYYNHYMDNLSDKIIKSEITIDDLKKINQRSVKEYLQIGTHAAEIAKNDSILPDTEIKIVLDADIETRIFCRMNQIEYENDFTSIFDDLIQRDFKSYDLIQQA
ncbi:1670_t:CDS:2 [Cetraspora pellucida]|uniref:1670_t:CDS:1 n=1 Tax=Cetraspora pellucida TaxID=1433469 RepID=A0A9N9K8D6_9GLOM|nr:1670_t:CDS:2 [Cetraspora pellucida]